MAGFLNQPSAPGAVGSSSFPSAASSLSGLRSVGGGGMPAPEPLRVGEGPAFDTRRPFADAGKMGINLLATSHRYVDPNAQRPPKLFEGVPILEQLGEAAGVAGEVVGTAINPINTLGSHAVWNLNAESELGQKYRDLVAQNVVGESKARAMMFRDWLDQEDIGPELLRDVVAPGESGLLGTGLSALNLLGVPQRAVIRTLQPMIGRLDALTAATDEQLENNPQLITIRDAYKTGAISEDEAYDDLIYAGFGLANPLGGGVGILGSAALELFSDPVNLISLGGGVLARSTGKAALTATKALSDGLGQEASETITRSLAARGIGASARDFLDEAISNPETVDKAYAILNKLPRVERFLALEAPTVMRIGRRIENVLDPLTLFGRDGAGKLTQTQFANAAGQGFYRGLGLGDVYRVQAQLKGLGDDAVTSILDGLDTAGMNIAMQVGNNESVVHILTSQRLLGEGVDPTTVAGHRAMRLGGKGVSRRVQDLTERVRYKPLPMQAGAAGVAEMMAKGRARAAAQIVALTGRSLDEATAVAERLDEKGLSIIDMAHYGKVGTDFTEAKLRAVRAGGAQADRYMFVGPRQLTKQHVGELRKMLKAGDMTAIRAFMERFDDLGRGAYDLTDDKALRSRLNATIGQLERQSPSVLDAALAPEMRDWIAKYGGQGYGIGLRPADEDIARAVIDDTTGNSLIVSANPWIEFVTEKTARQTVTRAKVIQNQLFGKISGATVLREAADRFVRFGAERFGASEETLRLAFKVVQQAAEENEVTTRGLSVGQMYRAALEVMPPGLKSKITEREFARLVVQAHEGSLRTVGVSQKFTGATKTAFAGSGNGVGQLAEKVYPNARFRFNPFFQLQEVTETPFFLLLRGSIPLSDLRKVWTKTGRAEMRDETERTLKMIEDLGSRGGNYLHDAAEYGMLYQMGASATRRALLRLEKEQRSRIGSLLGWGTPNVKAIKEYGVARQFEYDLAKRMTKAFATDASPESWKAFTTWMRLRHGPGRDEHAISQFYFDAVARANPDSIYSLHGPSAFKPEHLGVRSRISRRFVVSSLLGEETSMSWDEFRTAIRDPKRTDVTADALARALDDLGADPHYIERAVMLATGPSSQEWFSAIRRLGATKDETNVIRDWYDEWARERGMSLDEWIATKFADVPRNIDRLGDYHGRTLFQKLSESLEATGLTVPTLDSDEVAATVARARAGLPVWTAPTPGAKVKDLPRIEKKRRDFERARVARETDPSKGMPNRITAITPEQGRVIQATYDAVDDALKRVQSAKTLDESISGWNEGIEESARRNGMLSRPDLAGTVYRDERGVLYAYDAAGDLQGTMVYTAQPGSYGVLNIISRTPGQGTATRLYDAALAASGNEFYKAIGQTGLTPSGRAFVESWLRKQGPRVQREAVAGSDAIPGFGVPEPTFNPNVFKNEGGEVIGRLGHSEPDDWLRQVEAAFDHDVDDIIERLDWYPDIRRTLVALGKGDPELGAKLLLGFSVSQRATSPEDGMRLLFEAVAQHKRGEPITIGGLTPVEIARAVEEGAVSEYGLAQKLADFIDSVLGSERRSVGVDGPNPGKPWQPVAFDVWMKRDAGFLDSEAISKLERVYKRQYGPGTRVGYMKGGDLTVTLPSGETHTILKRDIGDEVPSDLEYDYGVQTYNERAEYANSVAWLGRTDWTAPQMQTLGWFKGKVMYGDSTGSPYDAIHRNRRDIYAEVIPAPDAPNSVVYPGMGDDGLDFDTAQLITDEWGSYVQMEVEELLGVTMLMPRGGNGVWTAGETAGSVVPNTVFAVVGTKRDAIAASKMIGFLTQQEGVPAMRWANVSQSARITGKDTNFLPAFHWGGMTRDEAKAAMRTLADDPWIKANGASLVPEPDGKWGVVAMWTDDDVWETAKRNNGAIPAATIKAIHTKLPPVGNTVPESRVVESTYLPNSYADNPGGESHLEWLRENGYGRQAERLVSDVRARSRIAYERAYQKHYAHGLERWRTERATADPEGWIAAGNDLGDIDAGYGASTALDPRPGIDVERARDAARAGRPLFHRVGRTVVGATLFDAADGRTRIFLRKGKFEPDTILHELVHDFADELDPSARRMVLDAFNEAKGRPRARKPTIRAAVAGTPPPAAAPPPVDPWAGLDTRIDAEWEPARARIEAMPDEELIEVADRSPDPDISGLAADMRAAMAGGVGASHPASDVATKWRTTENKNHLRMEKDLVALEARGVNVNEAMDKLDDYRNIERSDFTDRDEYLEERQAAWDEVLDALDAADPDDSELVELVGRFESGELQRELKGLLADAERKPIAIRLSKEAADAEDAAKRAAAAAPPPAPAPAPVAPTPYTPLADWNEEVEEWFANQMVEWVRTGEAPRRELIGVFGFYQKYIGAVKRRGKLSPEAAKGFDTILSRRAESAYGFNPDEALLLDFTMGQADRSARNARDLVHFKAERSWAERSLNHPYFGLYPLSYMWGKVLPELIEFLVFRPFGVPAPLVALNTVNDIYQSVMLQQEYDPELRKYLADNEPAFRALAMLVPGLPWELPVNTPLWMRRITEAVASQNQRQLEGKKNADGTPASIDLSKVDIGRIATDTAGYALNPVRGFESFGDTAAGIGAIGGLVGGAISGAVSPPESTPDPRTVEGPALQGEQYAPSSLQTVLSASGAALAEQLGGG